MPTLSAQGISFRQNTLNAPRDFILSQNASNLAANPFVKLMSNDFAIGLDWTLANNDATAGHTATVFLDGVEIDVPIGQIEAHQNEPYNSFIASGLCASANIRVAGILISTAKNLKLI